MNPQLSPLTLLDFAIINCNFRFAASQNNSNIQNIISEYLIDVDFTVIQEADNTRVFIKTAINQGETQMPGYSIFAEGVAVFKLSKTTEFSDDDENALLQYSTVSIAFSSLRGFISSLTAHAPFGKYILPSIDINDLFRQKTSEVAKTNTTKK